MKINPTPAFYLNKDQERLHQVEGCGEVCYKTDKYNFFKKHCPAFLITLNGMYCQREELWTNKGEVDGST